MPCLAPHLALTEIVRVERERSYAVVREATRKYLRKARAAGKVVDLRFSTARDLGLTLRIVSKAKSGHRDRVLVEATRPSCPYWPDELRPSDELVAIDGKLLVEPSRENFAGISEAIVRLGRGEREFSLTFVLSARRDKAFALQQKRHTRKKVSFGVPTASSSQQQQQHKRKRKSRRFRGSILSSVSFVAGDTTEDNDDEAVDEDAVAESLLSPATTATEDDEAATERTFDEVPTENKVDLHAVLRQARGTAETSTLRRGDLVRVKEAVTTPRLGWRGGSPADGVSHASVGVVTDVDDRNDAFALATVCFSEALPRWQGDAADLERCDNADDAETEESPGSRRRRREEVATLCEEERRRLVEAGDATRRAYIFQQQQPRDDGSLRRERVSALADRERAERSRLPRRVGSTHAAHVALVDHDFSHLTRWKRRRRSVPKLAAPPERKSPTALAMETFFCLVGLDDDDDDTPMAVMDDDTLALDFTDIFYRSPHRRRSNAPVELEDDVFAVYPRGDSDSFDSCDSRSTVESSDLGVASSPPRSVHLERYSTMDDAAIPPCSYAAL